MERNGRGVVITGSARGIGAGIALEMAKEGYSYIGLNYSSDEESCLGTAAEVRGLGAEVEIIQADVTKKEECERLVTTFIERFGKIDVLVNNAGGGLKIPSCEFDEMPLEYWDSQIALNLCAAAYCSHYAIADMKKKGTRGRIVNISSQLSYRGWVRRQMLPYSSAKGGLNAFTMTLANEVAKYDIKVNAVAPGFILTRATTRYTPEQRQQYINRIPAGFLGEPVDIANMVVFLSDLEKPRYIVGQTILIDGGQLNDGTIG